MPSLLPTNVQRRPLARPIERDTIRTFVEVVEPLKMIIFDSTGAVVVEESKSNLILGIRFGEEILEIPPVMKIDPPNFSSIGDSVENGILVPLDFMLPPSSAMILDQLPALT